MEYQFTIDINADVAEGVNNEAELIPYLSSCNVCCGAHAGDRETIKRVIDIANEHNITIGAHPSYPDRANFGRLPMELSKQELKDSLTQQLDLVFTIAAQKNVTIRYIKLHGALYHKASTDEPTIQLVWETIDSYNLELTLLGLANSLIEKKSKELTKPFGAEAFADRAYTPDGHLKSRKEGGALLSDPELVWKQVYDIISTQSVDVAGKKVNIKADSICFHGDTENAISLLQHTWNQLQVHGIQLKSFVQ